MKFLNCTGDIFKILQPPKEELFQRTKDYINLKDCWQGFREVIAYEICTKMDLLYIPHTSLSNNGTEKGSVQKFVKEVYQENQSPKKNSIFNAVSEIFNGEYSSLKEIIKIIVFDDLIGSTDRHLGNIGVTRSGDFYLFDNGESFAFAPEKAMLGSFGSFLLPWLSNWGGPLKRHKLLIKNIKETSIYIETKKEFKEVLEERKEGITEVFNKYNLPEKEVEAFWKRGEIIC